MNCPSPLKSKYYANPLVQYLQLMFPVDSLLYLYLYCIWIPKKEKDMINMVLRQLALSGSNMIGNNISDYFQNCIIC